MSSHGSGPSPKDATAATIPNLVPLTDADLERGGLRPVRAFVRTRQSAAAIRTARHRQRQAAAGLRQVNVVVPDTEEARIALKRLAEGIATGLITPGAIERLVRPPRPESRGAEATGSATATPPAASSTQAAADIVARGSRGGRPVPVVAAVDDHLAEDIARLRRILEKGGWRAALIRLLAGAEARSRT